MMRPSHRRRGIFRFPTLSCTLTALIAVGVIGSVNRFVEACPFCSAINLTFTEQLAANDIVVIAELLELPEPPTDPNAELPKATFEINKIFKGEDLVRTGVKFRTLLVGKHEVGENFLVWGVDPPNVAWSTPMKASPRVVEYISLLGSLPESGPERLMFFQDYFEDEESVLAFDAYDEFARAPYEDVLAMKDQMDHDQLVEWIKDPETSINRRRLYLTMLGVCGTEQDAEMLEGFITSGDRKKQAGLDALVACYLNLRGADGVKLIEDTFIRDQEVEYVDTLAAVSALRFHGTELEIVPKERIVAAVRLLLDRPKMADMIIPDLARWEDWSVMERLVQMFKDADDESNWIRVPVITYLRACPKPEAEKYIEELAKIDPDAVKRADFFLGFEMDAAADDSNDGGSGRKAGEETEKGDRDKGESEGGDGAGPGPEKVNQNSNDGGDTSADGGAISEADEGPDGEEEGRFVALKPPSAGESGSGAAAEAGENESLAQVAPAPAAMAVGGASVGNVTLVLLVPLFSFGLIFLLLWSVICGWFERLIV